MGIGVGAGAFYFLALGILTGPAHGPLIEVVVVGVAVAVALLFGATRLRRRASAPLDRGPYSCR